MTTIGIDLGTTNSLVSYFKNDRAVIIPNVLGQHLTPSVVGVDDNGEILVGSIAKERLLTHPLLTASNFKRFMGTDKKYKLGEYTFSPEDLSSFVLKSLKSDAENYLHEEITEAVISVPAYFNDAQRKATKRAGELAGLKVERLISEPTAAAVAYGLHENQDDTQFLVFDLGGGTFDVSILELFEGVMEVKSIAGDNYLGGTDFDNILLSYFLDKNNIDIKLLSRKCVSSLLKKAEECKKMLSDNESAEISIIIEDNLYKETITRNQFESICSDLITRIKYPIQRALSDAQISPRELDNIILIGGSSRMSLIKSIIIKMFNKMPYCNINPDEAVALGAAVQAALKERNSALKEVVLTDVCPYTLGVEVSEEISRNQFEPGYFLPIIERNSPIPISRVKTLCTIADNQTRLLVNIYQGESRHVSNNIKLGNLEIAVPKGPAGIETVDIRYTYDINGLLEVEVTINSTGEKKSLIIENSPGSMTDEEIKERLKALSSIKIHPRDKTENRLLIAKGERLYEESLGDKRQYISEILKKFEAILNTQDDKQIQEAREQIMIIFEELERQY
ncbi:MAG: molecular chaperone HscC [Inconstantimicrobium porci]|uniref:molecular chaperone HscC n=1 Tax=Inconstantimicrobium porci TaxID=2652291 RepID=UPI002A916207|nr:molecular chaperone HscC [Inconstantimicrobium porci]MDY5911346.1 molecular chaperone HscC [Inconstantimicrobium porci]